MGPHMAGGGRVRTDLGIVIRGRAQPGKPYHRVHLSFCKHAERERGREGEGLSRSEI